MFLICCCFAVLLARELGLDGRRLLLNKNIDTPSVQSLKIPVTFIMFSVYRMNTRDTLMKLNTLLRKLCYVYLSVSLKDNLKRCARDKFT
jgi:hypothetical protein